MVYVADVVKWKKNQGQSARNAGTADHGAFNYMLICSTTICKVTLIVGARSVGARWRLSGSTLEVALILPYSVRQGGTCTKVRGEQ